MDLPGLDEIADDVGKLTSGDHICRSILIPAQMALPAGHLPQVVHLGMGIAFCVVGDFIKGREHPLTRSFAVQECSVAVEALKEGVLVQDSKGKIDRVVILFGCNVAINVAIGISLGVPFCLLEAEFNEELEEIRWIEAPRQVGGICQEELMEQEPEELPQAYPLKTTHCLSHKLGTALLISSNHSTQQFSSIFTVGPFFHVAKNNLRGSFHEHRMTE